MKIIKENKLNEMKYTYNQKLFSDLDKFVDAHTNMLSDDMADAYLLQLATLFADYLSYAHMNLAEDTTLTINKNHILAIIKQTLV